MMKWKVMRNSRCNSIDHEDVRKSLEILDNVLAEFDDSVGEVWARLASDGDCPQKEMHVNGHVNGGVLKGNNDSITSGTISTFTEHSFITQQEDGATSQAKGLSSPDEERRFSPPPVPKRNPATRLSSREDLVTCASMENIYSNEFEIRRNMFVRDRAPSMNENSKIKPHQIPTNADLDSSNSLSNQSANSELIQSKHTLQNNDLAMADDSDEVFISKAKLSLFRSASTSMMTSESLQRAPSVASRRALYENSNRDATTVDSKRPVIHSDSGDPTFPVRNSPFLRRKFEVASSPVLSKRNISDSTDSKSTGYKSILAATENRSHPAIDYGAAVDGDASAELKNSPTTSSAQDAKDGKIAMLNKKFAEVRYLLKTGQIRPLDYGPPQFVPTPPPKKMARKDSDDSTKVISPPKLKNVPSSSDSVKHKNSAKKDGSALRCSVSVADSISSISGMLPTDTLKRPHLGLSYTMEDDLSPGIKEILTSTPKSDKSGLGLSTFSQSISSLGYGSGQSDLDLNLALREENKKVPITSLKSQTLPIGMKLGPPFFYSSDIDYDCDTSDRVDIAIDENIPSDKYEDENGHFRSFSAPPMKHLQRKNHSDVSKKTKKDDKEKNKKEDSVSLKSDHSMDDAILFRKIATLDGSTENQDPSGRKQLSVCSEGKTKRRSVWKSILRRK